MMVGCKIETKKKKRGRKQKLINEKKNSFLCRSLTVKVTLFLMPLSTLALLFVFSPVQPAHAHTPAYVRAPRKRESPKD